MSIKNAIVAIAITGIGAMVVYQYQKLKEEKVQLNKARAIVEPLLADVPGYNKPSR